MASGYYLVKEGTKVSRQMLEEEGAIEVKRWLPLSSLKNNEAMVLLVNNGPFMVAALLYDEEEYTRWFRSMDTRPKFFFIMDKTRAYEMAGYP